MGIRFRAAAVALALVCVGCDRNTTHMLSHELDGTWITDDARYRGRSMELSPTFVILVTGPDEPASVQWVNKVKSEPTTEGFVVTLESTDFPDGNSMKMNFEFSRANGGEIRFPNERRLWKRE